MFVDLSKAFDTIDHTILLHKLYCYGIRGISYDYIKNYLSNRFQYVEIDGIASDMRQTTCGVPQGSILGPILFLLYINDLPSCSKLLKLILFADDTTIIYSANDLDTLFLTINRELILLSDWFKLNRLSLNISKTHYMIFSNRKIEQIPPSIRVGQTEINRVSCTKFLGIEIDDKLTWFHHIKLVERKISLANFVIRSIRYKINYKIAMKL